MSRGTVSRRDAAAGGIAMLVLAAAAAGQAKAEELDGELLALCREFGERNTRIEELTLVEESFFPLNHPQNVAAWLEIRALVERGWEIRDRVATLQARTPEGLLAKARVALWETCDGDPEAGPIEGSGTKVAWSLARDVLGRAG
jgi:hypothetical protein